MATKPANMPDEQWEYAQQYGAAYGVDPLLLAAIAKGETAYGTTGLGRKGFTLGYGAYDSGADYKWQGVEKQYKSAASKLSRWMQGDAINSEEDLYRFQFLDQNKTTGWHASDPIWYKKIWNIYSGFLGGGGLISTSPATPTGPATFTIGGDWNSVALPHKTEANTTGGQTMSQYQKDVAAYEKLGPIEKIPAGAKLVAKYGITGELGKNTNTKTSDLDWKAQAVRITIFLAISAVGIAALFKTMPETIDVAVSAAK